MQRQHQRIRLHEAFATPAIKRRYVRRLFGTIADRYDLITRLLSFGLDQRWKRRVMAEARVAPGSPTLDLACGTGDLAFAAAAAGAQVIALDFAPRMIELARAKPAGNVVRWIIGDMGSLPVASDAIDTVTTGYGLRNVPDLAQAAAEIHRVLRHGGVLCALDFDRPERRLSRVVYLSYLSVIGSTLGWVLHRDPDTYRYIAASIRRYPGARGVAALLRDVGFSEVRHIPLLWGLMAIHVARK